MLWLSKAFSRPVTKASVVVDTKKWALYVGSFNFPAFVNTLKDSEFNE